MGIRDKELVNQARALKPIMAIGKNGITEGTIKLLRRELEQKQLVKVKLLKNFLQASGKDRHAAADELASYTGAQLIQVVGNVVVLHKK